MTRPCLYLEQPSRCQRVTGAALCCSVTVEGTTSLLPAFTHLLWSPTRVSFITYSTAEGWWWCMYVCVCHFWIPVLSLYFVSTCFCFFWSPHNMWEEGGGGGRVRVRHRQTEKKGDLIWRRFSFGEDWESNFATKSIFWSLDQLSYDIDKHEFRLVYLISEKILA